MKPEKNIIAKVIWNERMELEVYATWLHNTSLMRFVNLTH